jgi:hypothetical protein
MVGKGQTPSDNQTEMNMDEIIEALSRSACINYHNNLGESIEALRICSNLGKKLE